MNISAWKERLTAGAYGAQLAALYDAADAAQARYARLCEEYRAARGEITSRAFWNKYLGIRK